MALARCQNAGVRRQDERHRYPRQYGGDPRWAIRGPVISKAEHPRLWWRSPLGASMMAYSKVLDSRRIRRALMFRSSLATATVSAATSAGHLHRAAFIAGAAW